MPSRPVFESVAPLPFRMGWLRLVALLALASTLSSCVVTALVSAGYYGASGGLDHDAHVAQAWRGPQGELALALEDLQGVCEHEDHVLVLTAAELEQAFAAPPPPGGPLLPVAHVRLPRTILTRAYPLARPPAGSESCLPAAEWEVGPREVGGVERFVLPESLADAPLAVHWAHRYYAGAPDESGFALLVTRTSEKGVQRAVFLPEAFQAPGWTYALVPLSLLADALWLFLVFA